jgi:hypothetical protein
MPDGERCSADQHERAAGAPGIVRIPHGAAIVLPTSGPDLIGHLQALMPALTPLVDCDLQHPVRIGSASSCPISGSSPCAAPAATYSVVFILRRTNARLCVFGSGSLAFCSFVATGAT